MALEVCHLYADSLPIMYLLQEVAHNFQHSLDVGLVIPPGLCEGDPAQGIAQPVNYRLSRCRGTLSELTLPSFISGDHTVQSSLHIASTDTGDC